MSSSCSLMLNAFYNYLFPRGNNPVRRDDNTMVIDEIEQNKGWGGQRTTQSEAKFWDR